MRLRLFGTTQLFAEDGSPVASVVAQPKRLALLAYLAVAGRGSPRSRDEVLALFWPEHRTGDARNALRQALHYLRRSLRSGSIRSTGDRDLAIDRGLVHVDVLDFLEAVDAEAPERALELYAGEFMAGVHVSGCPDFDHWRDVLAEELRQAALGAADTLVERDAVRGRLADAAGWARRAVQLAPASETRARTLMRLLARQGDRSGAVDAFERFASVFRDELELEPAPETMELLDEIRAGRFGPGPAPLPLGPAQAPEPFGSRARPAPARQPAGLIAAGAVAATAAVVLLAPSGAPDPRAAGAGAAGPDAATRIVILPFEHVGPEERRYFAAGVTEEITSRLASVAGLHVIARQTALVVGADGLPARAIGDELDVGWVLEGTVRFDSGPDGDLAVRITPQLIRTSDETHAWADSYTFVLGEGEVFGAQAEIAARVAAAMDVALAPAEGAPAHGGGTTNPAAHDTYLRGFSYLELGRRRRTRDDRRLAVTMFERAIELDASYGDAWAGLAETLSLIFAAARDPEVGRRSVAAGERAVELAPTSPTAHQALILAYLRTGRSQDGVRQAEAARRVAPDHPEILLVLALADTRRGDNEAALANLERALRLDPRSPQLHFVAGETALRLRRYGDAEEHFARVLDAEPDHAFAAFWKIVTHLSGDGAVGSARTTLRGVGPRAFLELLLVSWDYDDEMVLRVLAEDLDPVLARYTLADPTDSAAYYFARGDAARRGGESGTAGAYYDSARVVLEGRLRTGRQEPRSRANLALALARSGRSGAARARADSLGGMWRGRAAEVALLVGDHDIAVERLQALVGADPMFTPALLRVDPFWGPLADHAGFRALVGG